MVPLRYGWLWFALGLGAVAVILALALTPLSGRMPADVSDKFLHFIAFLGLTVWFLGVFRRDLGWQVALALALYGVLIELLQSFTPYRSAELADVLSDCLGIGAGWILASAGLHRWCAQVETFLGVAPATNDKR